MPTIYDFTLPRILLKQRAPKIDIVPDTICPKFNDLLSMFWQIFVCSAKSAKDNNKKAANNYLISRKKVLRSLFVWECWIEITCLKNNKTHSKSSNQTSNCDWVDNNLNVNEPFVR